MDFKQEVARIMSKAAGLTAQEVVALLETPPAEKMGELAFPCFSLAKKFKKAPAQISQELRQKIAVPEKSIVEKVEFDGPYLNFFFKKDAFAEQVLKEASKENFGKGKKSEKVMIEYSNPNPLKGFHVGHFRNTALGAALARIMEFSGFEVIPVNYYNDTGSHVSKTLWAYDKWYKDKENKVANKGEWIGLIYVHAAEELQKNPEQEEHTRKIQQKLEEGEEYWDKLHNKLRYWSTDEFSRIYKELGAGFKKIYWDSEFVTSGKKIVNQLSKHNLVYEEDGAPILNLEDFGLGKKALLRGDETALYITKDLALVQQRFKDFKLDRLIYVVGSEQKLYFQQLFKTLEILGFKEAKQLYHLSYELVLDAEGKKFSSRKGNAPLYSLFAEKAKEKALKEVLKRNKEILPKVQKEIADKIAIGAMLYWMLKYSNNKTISFDLDKALEFQGDTGPYLQYSLVRARKILKKAELKPDAKHLKLLTSEQEFKLVKQISKFPEIVDKAAESYQPHMLANYAFELASMFAAFYEKCDVIHAEENLKAARLFLVQAFLNVIRKALELLGIREVEVT